MPCLDISELPSFSNATFGAPLAPGGFEALSSDSRPLRRPEGPAAKARHPASSEVLSAGMALITVNAVVHVPTYVRVVEIGGVVVAMAARALEDRIVTPVDVARRADAVCVAVVHRESRVVRVRECRTSPGARGMAGLASRREELRLRGMRRVCSAVVIGLMTRDAEVAVQAVVVVYVAVGAYPWRHGMQSGQREAGVVMVKRRICPVDGIVAHFARSRESSCCVRWRRSACIVLLVARIAKRAI